MKILLVTAALGLGLIAIATAGARTTSGLRGQVLIAPGYPRCLALEPCTRPGSHVVLVFSRHGRLFKRTVTAGDGTFRIALRPGAYTVTAPGASLRRVLDPTRVVVPRHRYRRQVFKLDIGIR